MSDYTAFLASKRELATPVGFECTKLSDRLFPFQRDIVRWACARGRAAIFADTGLGKTPMQLEWARQVHWKTSRRVLILAPLAVSSQTQREGAKFGIDVRICRSGDDVEDGVNVTNYDRLHLFDSANFGGIVLDESSILKGFDGSMRKRITDFARAIHYRLACTATPAPNDLIEITNHAEFLDVMSGKEILALFFKQDGNTTHAWRLKGHAREDFWRWMASWSVALRKPSDLGYENGAFDLPPLEMHEEVVAAKPVAGELFVTHAASLADVRAAQRESLAERVARCAALVNASREPWIVWCNLNAEADALTRVIPGAVNVQGSDSPEKKDAPGRTRTGRQRREAPLPAPARRNRARRQTLECAWRPCHRPVQRHWIHWIRRAQAEPPIRRVRAQGVLLARGAEEPRACRERARAEGSFRRRRVTYEIQAERNGRWRTVGSSDLRFAAEAAAEVKADKETRVRVIEAETRTVVFEVHGGVE